ncbi:transcription factor bHLH113-like [Aristolochia californica]|uniref:transcription factor bHLH113-like n=1 Tax=Aristolochia californica TaxID=171875 RepID=UPI0035DCB4E3
MATREDFARDRGFVQLLESGDVGFGMAAEDFMHTSSFSAEDPQRLLSFGEGGSGSEIVLPETVGAPQKSGVTGSDSSSTSSSSGRSFSQLRKPGKGGDGKVVPKLRSASEAATVSISGNTAAIRKTNKKPKSEPQLKVRKEKLGERITALQLLVSPFGKTDTASVLHEAMGYIRFLHEQVQVLSCPYLQRLPSSGSLPGGGNDEVPGYDLRSRGLCLVPVAFTENVANSNGADFWSPAMGSHSSNC